MGEGREDARLDFPATGRNAEAIFRVLRRVLPDEGLVLEIGSGSGQHALRFARGLPSLRFQPSDLAPEHVASVEAWRVADGTENILPALRLDVMQSVWPVAHADAVICSNVIHIAPWEVTLALFRGASRVLLLGGPLLLYGPFMRDGAHTAPSNARFDQSLRGRDERWGVRDLDQVSRVAEDVGLRLEEVVEMPANNLSVVFQKGSGGS